MALSIKHFQNLGCLYPVIHCHQKLSNLKTSNNFSWAKRKISLYIWCALQSKMFYFWILAHFAFTCSFSIKLRTSFFCIRITKHLNANPDEKIEVVRPTNFEFCFYLNAFADVLTMLWRSSYRCNFSCFDRTVCVESII